MKRNLIVSIIGRPNVGKSSIFNTFIRQGKRAITHDRPGITRDRNYSLVSLDELPSQSKKEFIIIDTGGFFPEGIDQKMVKEDHFFDIMTEHAKLAIEESDLVLFIVDVKEGLTPFDFSIANEIRKSKKDFWLIINKVDNPDKLGQSQMFDFFSLGINEDQMFPVSAAHGRGLQSFKERLQKELNKLETTATDHYLQIGVTPRDDVVARVALIGAPNAGKSTLLNQFIGEKRALVSDIAGTTLDPIEGFFDLYYGEESHLLKNVEFTKDDKLLLQDYQAFQKNNESSFSIDDVFNENENENENEEKNETEGSFWRTIHIIDTAGIRKKSHVNEIVEEKSVFRSLRCITESDICLIMVDATIGISHHDRRLIDIALDKGKSIIIALNKIDLLKDKLDTFQKRKEWVSDIKAKHSWLEFCAIVPISAKFNNGVGGLKKVLKTTTLVRHIKIPTGALNTVMTELVDRNPLLMKRAGGVNLKLKYISQLKSNPPTFLLFTNKSKGISDNYQRYLKNGLRSNFKLENTPIHFVFRTSSELKKRALRFKGIRSEECVDGELP